MLRKLGLHSGIHRGLLCYIPIESPMVLLGSRYRLRFTRRRARDYESTHVLEVRELRRMKEVLNRQEVIAANLYWRIIEIREQVGLALKEQRRKLRIIGQNSL